MYKYIYSKVENKKEDNAVQSLDDINAFLVIKFYNEC